MYYVALLAPAGVLAAVGAVLGLIDQSELIKWGAAVATSVGTIAAAAELAGRRLFRVWVEETGKLADTERGQYEALKHEFTTVKAELAAATADRQQLQTVLAERLNAIEDLSARLLEQMSQNAGLLRQVLDLSTRVAELTEELARFRCSVPLPDGSRCRYGSPPQSFIEATDLAHRDAQVG